jgi:hypothetical protein
MLISMIILLFGIRQILPTTDCGQSRDEVRVEFERNLFEHYGSLVREWGVLFDGFEIGWISTSQDSNLIITSSWDNEIAFRSNGEVFSFRGTPWAYGSEEYSDIYVGKIHTVKIKDRTHYLIEGILRYDHVNSIGIITAFKIENDSLKRAKIFKNENDTLCTISVDFDFDEWYDRTRNVIKCPNRTGNFCCYNTLYGIGFDWIFSFDEKTNTLYVPLVINDTDDNDPDRDYRFGFVTDQYLRYQLKGDKFQYVGTYGGFWLYPDIRNFIRLERFFEMKKYLVRVDFIGNGKYRYVLWSKGKPILDKPDFIFEDGNGYLCCCDLERVFFRKGIRL